MAIAAGRSVTTATTTVGDEAEVIRHNGGWLRPWQPGKSGNPSGVGTSAYHQARRMCAQATPEAVSKLIDLMRTSTDERVTFMCADALIRRGAGPIRDHSAEDDATSRISLDSLTADERKALVTLLRRALGG